MLQTYICLMAHMYVYFHRCVCVCVCVCVSGHRVYTLGWTGFPGGASGKEPTCQCRRRNRHKFNPWVRKIPWKRKWQPTPVFLPGESHEQTKPGRLQSIGLQRVWCDWSNLAYTGLNSVPPNSCPGFRDGTNSKESACIVGDLGSILGLGRCPAEGNGNPLQYSGLENCMDGGAWRSIVHGVAKSWTWLSN